MGGGEPTPGAVQPRRRGTGRTADRRCQILTHSANIDAVSGATYTSSAYRSSLQAALDRANG